MVWVVVRADPWCLLVRFKRKHTQIGNKIFRALLFHTLVQLGTEDLLDRRLLLVLLLNCKQQFVSLDSQMKPEDVNKDPDCTARHAQGCHRACHIGLWPGDKQALQAAAAKMYQRCIMFMFWKLIGIVNNQFWYVLCFWGRTKHDSGWVMLYFEESLEDSPVSS